MKAVTQGAMFAAATMLGLGLAGCDSRRENAADATADAIDHSASRVGGTAGAQMNTTADTIRESGEAKADAMEDAADRQGR